jgi:hypothetical protein
VEKSSTMLKPDVSSIEALMKRSASKIIGQAALAAKSKDEDVAYIKNLFGFLPQDVEGIHTRKEGEGEGLWFRLKDGRVFSNHGKPSSANPALYDKVS